jgi:hypothetical protein
MIKLPPTLLALSLSLALAAVPASALAQQISTSQGVRTLPRTEGMKSEAELRQVLASTEQVLALVMRDVEEAEKSYAAVSGSAAGFGGQVKSTRAEYDAAKAAFEQSDQSYRDQVAAYDRRRAEFEADVQRQRAAAAPLEALPSAQRDINEVFRINEWSERIGKEREAINAEGQRLVAENERVEQERTKLEKLRTETDAAVRQQRSSWSATPARSRTPQARLPAVAHHRGFHREDAAAAQRHHRQQDAALTAARTRRGEVARPAQ